MDGRDPTDDSGPHFETRSVTAGEEPVPGDDVPGDVTMPIHLSSTFALDGVDTDVELEDLDPEQNEYIYSRLQNPTRNALEHRLASLEGADHGMAFVSGTAAIFTAVTAVVQPGDHLVAFDDLYGGTNRMFQEVFEDHFGVDVTFVDATDPENVAAAATDRTELVWMETPTNPLLKLCDVGAIADVAADHDATFGVDNTFMSPYFQNPLDLGADVVVHSTTKYINGHSDSVGGAVLTSDDELAESMGFLQQVGLGNVLSPFDAYQVLRGTKTLAGRMRQHEANAMAVAEFLEGHEAVEAVHYPGLESHPQHSLASRQASGYGGVLSFELAGGLEAVHAFVAALDDIPLAVSLGGVESLVEHPASMTHAPLEPEEREALGISDSLLRMSVGIEHQADIVASLDRSLEAVPVDLKAGR
ncbi:trans-sulfuration enzyme family protein [Halobacteriales archaeon Cl-PHB]